MFIFVIDLIESLCSGFFLGCLVVLFVQFKISKKDRYCHQQFTLGPSTSKTSGIRAVASIFLT
jgi:hypothetical protein